MHSSRNSFTQEFNKLSLEMNKKIQIVDICKLLIRKMLPPPKVVAGWLHKQV